MLSTPLICCSIGVATDCSTVKASAPTYVVFTWTSGGVMLGNCAVGKLSIATMPTMTITMEITMDTMGRFMKNLYTMWALRCVARSVRLFRCGGLWLKRFCLNFHSLADFLHSFRHVSVTGLWAFVYNPHGVNLSPHFDRTNAYLVVVTNYGNEVTALQFVHSTLRNKHSVPLNSDSRADLAKPAGTQQV